MDYTCSGYLDKLHTQREFKGEGVLKTMERFNCDRFKCLIFSMLFFLIFSIVTIVPETVHADVTDPQSIKIVQETLNKEGFNCGTADGVAGNNTRAAIEDYQKEHDLEVTGDITQELIDSLGLSSQILSGLLVSEFVQKYNYGVNYCNANSALSGDPTIAKISISDISTDFTRLDGNTTVSYLLDNRHIAVYGVMLSRDNNTYDIPMVYELVSAVYALDTSFLSIEEVIDFCGGFVENHIASTDRMDYSAVTHDGQIYFAVVPKQ